MLDPHRLHASRRRRARALLAALVVSALLALPPLVGLARAQRPPGVPTGGDRHGLDASEGADGAVVIGTVTVKPNENDLHIHVLFEKGTAVEFPAAVDVDAAGPLHSVTVKPKAVPNWTNCQVLATWTTDGVVTHYESREVSR